jgi:glutathione S-transferase
MIKLYYASGACSFIPHVALELVKSLGLGDYEPLPVKLHKGEQRSAEYLAMNPNGQVPLLVVDGQPLTQIVAICDYIDRRFPQAKLLPEQGWARAQALSTLAWMNNTVHPTFTHVFMPGKFTDDAAAQASVKAHAIAQYRTLLQRMESMVGEASAYWLGEQLSLLDPYALTLLRWGGFGGIDPASLPVLSGYVARVAQHPQVAAVMAREKIALDTFKG